MGATRSVATTDPSSMKIGGGKQIAFPPTSQNHQNGGLFFDLRSPLSLDLVWRAFQ